VIQADLLGERARLTPGKTALVVVPDGDRWTYRELDDRARAAASAWRDGLGLVAGDRVGILAHNRPEYVDAFFAAGKGGVTLVTLGTRLTARELRPILEAAGPRAVLYDGAFADTVDGLRATVPDVRWIALDAPAHADDARWSDLVGAADGSGFTPERCDPEHPYCLLYTSGTTGKPKGVVVPHRMVAWNGLDTVACWQLREDDVSPIFTPLYHAGGLMAFLTPLFTVGGTIVLHRGFDVAEIWKTIERERCTVVLGVPTIWKLLADAPEFATASLDHVRWFISGGAPLPRSILDLYQARGIPFKQGFGMTEVGVNCFSMTLEDSVVKAGSIGKPMMYTEVRLVGEDGRDVPDGEVGEMWFRGPHVCAGYWRDPEATAAAITAEGWFRSGDLARRDPDGFFFVAGRGKDMLISGGVNVYPAEIENEVLQHPGVADCAVVGVPDETWGEVAVAFVVAEGTAAPDEAALATFLGGRIAQFKVPRRWEFVDALPRTPYGKVIKADLRDRLLRDRGEA
jgi:fatty-acyl-CoA synthase